MTAANTYDFNPLARRRAQAETGWLRQAVIFEI
jgi:hypothetical protein